MVKSRVMNIFCIMIIIMIMAVQGEDVIQTLLWPQPTKINMIQSGQISLNENWECKIVSPNNLIYSSDILNSACKRYHGYISKKNSIDEPNQNIINTVKIQINQINATLNLETNETYSITIDERSSSVNISAENTFGALRALETFSQLVSENFTLPFVNIMDSPRFNHRELLVDTARYYLNISFLEHIIDSMSFSKLNVLHWHAIDSQSFPIESKKYPLLSEKGQFKGHSHLCASASCVYSETDIRNLIEYAKQRGIRVMLEVDTPGHSKSWGQAYKNMTVNFCTLNADSVPLNPTIPFTLDVVSGFINEMISGSNPIFPDEFIHLGGDEVDLNCWEKNKAIEEYMTKNHLTTATLLSQWISQVRKNVDDASNNNKRVMYWEDAFNYTTGLTKNSNNKTVFAVWKDKQTLHSIANSGSATTLSAGWYIHSQSKWTDFYDNEPFDGNNTDWTPAEKMLVYGGAVSYWGCSGFCPFPFTADKFDSRTWPVAAAAAERLWSSETVTDHTQALPRLVAHTKRLMERGVRVGKLR